jgi:PAS domain S-box-containing protein
MKTVLLVEDEALIALNEASMLERQGYEVVTVHNAERAIDTAVNADIDLILMDIDLGRGKIDGTEAAESILSKRELPIVFLTSHTEREYVERIKKISGYGYVLKSAGEFILLESINMAFKLFEAHKELKREIEERKNTERKLTFQAMLLDQIQDRVTATDLKGNITYVNQAECRSFGKPPEELIGMNVKEYGEDPVRGATQQEIIDTTLREGKWHGEVVNIAEDGREVIFDARTQLIYDEGGNPSGMLGISTDITERKRSEEEAAYEQSLMRLLLDNIPDYIYFKDKERRFVRVSDSFCRLAGYRHGEITGKKDEEVLDIFTDEVTEASKRDDEQVIQTGKPLINKKENRETTDGKTRWFLATKMPWRDTKGNIIGLFGISKDITNLEETEQRLKKTIEEKDFLMKEINHRIKNNLVMVSSLISLKDASLGDSVDLSDLSNQIDAIRIVHEKLFQTEDVTRINVREYAEHLLETVLSFSGTPVEIENKMDAVKIHTRKAVSIGLIINEIATNAVKYGFRDDGNTSRFTASMKKDEASGQFVLKLSNSGEPFPADIDIEQPETLGLQLITVLVDQLKGTIELTRSPHPVFTIRFPIEVKK